MKRTILSILLLLAMTPSVFAGAFLYDKKLQACLQAASDAARTPPPPGSIGGGVDYVKLDQGYCQCYTTKGDQVLMARYCH